MKQRHWRENPVRRQGLAKRLRLAEDRLRRIVETSDRRGYTGMVGSRGAFTDDPLYRAAMKRYDEAFDGFFKDIGRRKAATKHRTTR